MPTRPLHVVITGDPKGFQRALAQAGASTDVFAGKQKGAAAKAQAAGSTMTKGLTVPLLAMGVGAAKMSADFDDSMQRIVGLVGLGQREVDGMKKSVLALSQDTGAAPKELADALFFITSAGLKGRSALDALEASAKASQAGLGDTKVVADAVTSAMNNYGPANLTAAAATDVLTAAVKEGKTEASALAPVLGRVLPVAESLGVSFNEVGAGLASLTRTGFNAAEASTALRGVLNTFNKPATQTVESLDKMGLSVDEVRASIRDRGLLSTLVDLRDRAKENDVEMSSLFPNVRALGGALSLTGRNAKANEGIFRRMADTTGLADKAFQSAESTARDQFADALNSAKVAAVSFGGAILPAVIPVLAAITAGVIDVSAAFRSLPPELQQTVVIAGLVVAALGPVLWTAGRVGAAIGVLRGGVAVLGVALTPLRMLLIAAGVAMAVFGGHTGTLGGELAGIGGLLGTVGGALMSVAGTVSSVLSPVASLAGAFAKSEVGARLLQGVLTALIAAGFAALAARVATAIAPMLGFARALLTVQGATTAAAIGMQRLKLAIASNPIGAFVTALGFAVGALGLFNTQQRATRLTAEQVADAVLNARNAIDRYNDVTLGVRDASLQAREATLNYRNAVAERNKLQKSGTATSRQLEQADLAVERAELEMQRATQRAGRAQRDATKERQKAVGEARSSIGKLREHASAIRGDIASLIMHGKATDEHGNATQAFKGKLRELQRVEQQLQNEQNNLAGATRGGARKTVAALASVASGGIPPLGAVKDVMRSLGRVRVNMGGFIGSIVGGLRAAWTTAVAWVARIREQMKKASPSKRDSPSPNELVAAGFSEMGKVVDAGFADVHGRTVRGTGQIRAALKDAAPAGWTIPGVTDDANRVFDIDQQIRDLQAGGEAARAQQEANDKQAEIAAARAATRSRRRKGEEERDYQQRIKDARDALADLIKEEERAQAQAQIDFQISGLERIRSFNDAIRDIGDTLKAQVQEVVETRIVDRLKAELAPLDEATGTDPRAAELRGIRGRQAEAQRAREDADAQNKINAARLAEQKAADRVRKARDAVTDAELVLQRAQRTGSQRLIDMASRRHTNALAQLRLQETAQQNAHAEVVAAEQEQAALGDERRAAELQAELETARQAAEARAEAARAGHDAEINSFAQMLQWQLDAELAQLQQRTHSYQHFVNQVMGILGPLGGAFAAAADQEAAIAAPEPQAPPVADTRAGRKKRRKRRALGGEVLARAGELTRINELGPEDLWLPRGARVVQASRSGTAMPTIGELNVYPQGRAGEDEQALAAFLGWQIATRFR